MSVADAIDAHEIQEVVHFTTNRGLNGILGSGAILARSHLDQDEYLEHVYQPNAQVRKDRAWLGHVNLSVSRLNYEFFDHSQGWHAHEQVWWCALGISPDVLELDDVVFTTTNNIYTGCRREKGEIGLDAMFAGRVTRWRGNEVDRPDDHPANWTTCHQAEVLVPDRVPVELLTRVYVATDRHADIVASECEILHGDSLDLPITVSPDVFEP